MAKKGKRPSRPAASGHQPPVRRSENCVLARELPNHDWQLLHPRCARERAEDIEEVEAMIEAGETEIASDELRWLLSGCTDFILAHRMLGELALTDGHDVPLARGHFGHAYQLGLAALRREKMPTPVPYALVENQAFFEAGKGLAYCLKELGRPELAREVIDQLLHCDPTDPLGLAKLVPPA